MAEKSKDSLVVIWTSGDREVAEKMVFLYTLNSRLREWWKEVTLVVWGPSLKLITEDTELQDYLEVPDRKSVRARKRNCLGFKVKSRN